jgi:hypothetical protein
VWTGQVVQRNSNGDYVPGGQAIYHAAHLAKEMRSGLGERRVSARHLKLNDFTELYHSQEVTCACRIDSIGDACD